MPKVKIGTAGVSVELEATETSIDTLGKQALDLYRNACEIDAKQRIGTGLGFANNRGGAPSPGTEADR